MSLIFSASVAAFCLASVSAKSVHVDKSAPVDKYKGLTYEPSSLETTECVNGKWHHTEYNVLGASADAFVDLDTLDHLRDVTCDLDGTRLQLKFTSDIWAAEYFVRFHDWNNHFIVGGTKWNCSVIQDGRPGLIIRRIVGASESGDTLNVQASNARYDEIFEDADISFYTEGTCDEQAVGANQDKKVCVGYNSECTGSATSSIPIFSNSVVNIDCSDCYADFTMDVFVDVSIRGFSVQNLSTGFRNMAINTSLVLDAKSAPNWNTGVDKTLPVLQNKYLVDFKIGVVPFMVFFDLPVELKADLSFVSQAEATVGAKVNFGIGDAFVSWDPESHWSHSEPTPALSTTPVFETSASFDATGQVQVIPTLTAHFDRILAYTLTATPTLNVDISGSATPTPQVCLKSTSSLSVQSTTTLDINIPWANIAKDWTWNKDVYESGSQNLADKCYNL